MKLYLAIERTHYNYAKTYLIDRSDIISISQMISQHSTVVRKTSVEAGHGTVRFVYYQFSKRCREKMKLFPQ